ncbi:unnamed protein product [Arctia plantaginis]|uniref:Uncharacterized protein n=1 Tax=Arctia plantaginis TaxID=874455 RepID=A0A8S1AU43_ARCPL|nr:unnamed protein product [Arctia plantaginis]
MVLYRDTRRTMATLLYKLSQWSWATTPAAFREQLDGSDKREPYLNIYECDSFVLPVTVAASLKINQRAAINLVGRRLCVDLRDMETSINGKNVKAVIDRPAVANESRCDGP